MPAEVNRFDQHGNRPEFIVRGLREKIQRRNLRSQQSKNGDYTLNSNRQGIIMNISDHFDSIPIAGF